MMIDGWEYQPHAPAWHREDAAIGPTFATVNAVDLAKLLRRVHRCRASPTEYETRWAVSGVLLVASASARTITATATDGRSLASQTVEATGVFQDFGSRAPATAISGRAVGRLSSFLLGLSPQTQVNLHESSPRGTGIGFCIPDGRLVVDFDQGAFPNFGSLLKGKTVKAAFTLRRREILPFFTRPSVIRMEFRRGSVRLEAAKSYEDLDGQAVATRTLAAEGDWTGRLVFDASRVVGLLSGMRGDTSLDVRSYGHGEPLEFRSDDGFVGMIMPLMRLESK